MARNVIIVAHGKKHEQDVIDQLLGSGQIRCSVLLQADGHDNIVNIEAIKEVVDSGWALLIVQGTISASSKEVGRVERTAIEHAAKVGAVCGIIGRFTEAKWSHMRDVSGHVHMFIHVHEKPDTSGGFADIFPNATAYSFYGTTQEAAAISKHIESFSEKKAA